MKTEHYIATAAIALIVCANAAFADDARTIVQEGRAFKPVEVTINRGDTLTFANRDEFIHQIYVNGAGMSFDSAEQPPGQNVPVQFAASGTFPVRCHIHPKMLLTVHVK